MWGFCLGFGEVWVWGLCFILFGVGVGVGVGVVDGVLVAVRSDFCVGAWGWGWRWGWGLGRSWVRV